MAVAAAEQTQIFHPEIMAPVAIHADSIAHIQQTRLEARQQAEQQLRINRQLAGQGEWQSVPLPVDALSTAHRVITAAEQVGKESPVYQNLYEGLWLDCARLRAEAIRKNKPELFPRVHQPLEEQTGHYTSNGIDLYDMVFRGLSPYNEPEEIDRRVNDVVEEATIMAVGEMAVGQAVSVNTISECPEWAIDAYQKNQKGPFGGYVPGLQKLMVRSVLFLPGVGRFEEQVALPGTHITHEVVTAVMADLEVIEHDAEPTRTEVHASQIIDMSGRGALEFAELLDQKASAMLNKNIFMGEEVHSTHRKSYAEFAIEAHQRQAAQTDEVTELTEYVLRLAENKTDGWAAEGLVENFLHKQLFAVAEKDPTQAEVIFDKPTARGIQQVMRLRELGEYERAQRLRNEVERNAPRLDYCGAGSCNLTRVDALSKKAEIAKEMGLSGDLLADNARFCIGCGQKSIVYSMSGDKACTNRECRLKQVKGKISRHKIKDVKQPQTPELPPAAKQPTRVEATRPNVAQAA